MSSAHRTRLILRCAIALGIWGPCASVTATGPTNVSGTISTSTTWLSANSPYIVTGNVYVEGASTPVLTIQPGVTVKFNAGVGLFVGNNAPGNLQAIGTGTLPTQIITFTASNPSAPWVGINFQPNAVSASKIVYSTLSYAGAWGGYAAITINGSSPTIQNTTIQQSSQWGVAISGSSSATISSSTITSNSPGGLTIAYPATPNLQTVAFTSNSGFAISQRATVTYATVSGVTATTNGTDGIELTGGPVDVNTTWKNAGIPYIFSAGYVESVAAPVLTINAGTVVKVTPGNGLFVGVNNPATLTALGTASQPITFTVNSPSPTAGSWPGIQLLSHASSASKISFATISYAGAWGGNGAIHVAGSSPALDNITFQNNSVAGLTVASGAPTLANSTFSNNTAGIINSSPATPITANLNYWSAASGPSGAGSGTGQSVSTGVVFEPWLIAAPTTTNYIKTSSEKNRTFNPSLSINTTLTSTTVSTGSWTTTIKNGSITVRTYTGSGTSSAVTWDGKDSSGNDQANGSYTYLIAMAGVTTAQGNTIIDRTKQLTLSGYGVSNAYFSPNADGILDTTTVSGTFSFDDVAWTLSIKNGASVVRTATGTGPSFAFVWDGKNTGPPPTVQPDSLYTMTLTATDGSASVPGSTSATLDTLSPVATITAPTNNQVLSNVYAPGGATNVSIVGTASDLNVSNWLLDYGQAGGWWTIATGTSSVTNAALASWVTLLILNGQYTLRLQVWDKAGNYKTISILNTIGNFKVAENLLEFNGSTGGAVTYTSTVPGLTPSLRETLIVKNASGLTVRTLLNNIAVTAGNRNDVWDGKNGSSVLQPDGPYFYVATVTDGTHSLTWDLSTQYLNNLNSYQTSNIQPFDPFNNQPMVLTRSFSGPGNVTIPFSAHHDFSTACTPPDFCWVKNRYEESGTKNYYWPGVDSTGRYRPDASFLVITLDRASFSANAVVLFGTKPSVTAVTVTPPMFQPKGGTQTVSFTLATYQSQSVPVAITFLNQDSMSVLRTISLTSQAPGVRTTVWDGKADNGVLVAPGSYLVTVTATDSLGNQGVGQIMTTVRY